MHSDSDSAKTKSYGSCGSGSGSTTLIWTTLEKTVVDKIRIRNTVAQAQLYSYNIVSRSGSGMNILDHISESLEMIFGLK
jgi:hypothetical protein